MSLEIPTYTIRYDATRERVLTDAYAWVCNLTVDYRAVTGAFMVSIDASAADANAGYPPLDGVQVTLGQLLVPADPAAAPPVEEVRFPDLPTLLARADALLAAAPSLGAHGAIRAAIYEALQALHPLFAGSTQVP